MKRFLAGVGVSAALLLPVAPVSATTILTSCMEDISCTLQGSVSVVTTAGHFDSSYARLALSANNTGGTAPPANRIQTTAFSTASSNFWFTGKYYPSSSSGGANVFVEFVDGSTARLLLRGNGTNQQVKISTRNGAGTLTDLSATGSGTICAASTLCKLDIHVVYAVAGSIDVYNNGSLILTFTGDVTTNSATTLSAVEVAGAPLNNASMDWSEIFASDTDTRSMRSATCAPSAAGATQNWTGSAANINANTAVDATFNYTVTNNDQSQWKSGCTIATTAGTTVVDVRSYARLAIGTTGPLYALFVFNESSTDYDSGSDLAGLATSFGNLKYDWTATSPATGIGWTPSELNTIFTTGGFGVKSRP